MSRLDNIYIQILIFTTIWMCIIGLADDYIKVFRKNKKGLKAKFKLFGQYILGIIVGLIILFHPEITISDSVSESIQIEVNQEAKVLKEVKSFKTTVPFFKDNELDYQEISNSIFNGNTGLIWIIFIPIIILIISSVSNSNNLTDGLDGLVAGSSSISFAGILVISFWIYRHPEYYSNFISDSFLTVDISLLISLGAEGLLLFFCFLFLIEAGSVIIQVVSFRYRKKRIFKMAPLHHHFEMKNWAETTVIVRFWIINGIFVVLGLGLFYADWVLFGN